MVSTLNSLVYTEGQRQRLCQRFNTVSVVPYLLPVIVNITMNADTDVSVDAQCKHELHFSPSAYEVRRQAMFLHVSVNGEEWVGIPVTGPGSLPGEGVGVPQSQVPGPFHGEWYPSLWPLVLSWEGRGWYFSQDQDRCVPLPTPGQVQDRGTPQTGQG